MLILLLLLIGLIGGILAGLLGIGGGLVFTPILFFLFIKQQVADPVAFTIATSLFCVILVSSSSTLKHIRQQNFSLKESLWIGILGILGTRLGKMITLSDWYSIREFAIVFSGILFYTAWSFLYQKKTDKTISASEPKEINWLAGLVIGGLGGFVATLSGLGGGIVMVPLLNKLYKKPFHQVVSLSSSAIVIISLAAVIQFALTQAPTEHAGKYAVGFVDFGAALPLALGGIMGANRGAKWSMIIDKIILQRIFAVLAIAEAIRLLVKHLF